MLPLPVAFIYIAIVSCCDVTPHYLTFIIFSDALLEYINQTNSLQVASTPSPAARVYHQQLLQLTPLPAAAIQLAQMQAQQVQSGRGHQHLPQLNFASPASAIEPVQKLAQDVTPTSASRAIHQQQLQLKPPSSLTRQLQQVTPTPGARSGASGSQEHMRQLDPPPPPASATQQASKQATMSIPLDAARDDSRKEILPNSEAKRKSAAAAAEYLSVIDSLLEYHNRTSVGSAEQSDQQHISNQSTEFGDGICQGAKCYTMSASHFDKFFQHREEFVRRLIFCLDMAFIASAAGRIFTFILCMCMCAGFTPTQTQAVSENRFLRDSLQQSKSVCAQLVSQLGMLNQHAIDAAVREVEATNATLSSQLRDALVAKDAAERRFQTEKGRVEYLSSFDEMVDANLQQFENNMAEEFESLKNAASSFSGSS
jgi:hypothetical protein